MGFGSEFEGQFFKYAFGVAVDDEADGFFDADAALLAVEELFFGDFAGGGLMFEYGAVVVAVGVGPGVGAAFVA